MIANLKKEVKACMVLFIVSFRVYVIHDALSHKPLLNVSYGYKIFFMAWKYFDLDLGICLIERNF